MNEVVCVKCHSTRTHGVVGAQRRGDHLNLGKSGKAFLQTVPAEVSLFFFFPAEMSLKGQIELGR